MHIWVNESCVCLIYGLKAALSDAEPRRPRLAGGRLGKASRPTAALQREPRAGGCARKGSGGPPKRPDSGPPVRKAPAPRSPAGQEAGS